MSKKIISPKKVTKKVGEPISTRIAKAVFEEYFGGEGINDYYTVKQLNK